MDTQNRDAPKRCMMDRFANMLLADEATKPKSEIIDCDIVDGDFTRYAIRRLAFKVSGGTLFVSPRAPHPGELTLAEIEKNPGMALGQITRQAGKIKRLTAKLAKAEKLAAARLHDGGAK